MTPDERHADVVARFPNGLTPAEFRLLALESADDDGRIDYPSLADWFAGQSILLRMRMDGLIERRCKPNEAGPWFITGKGRRMAGSGSCLMLTAWLIEKRCRRDETWAQTCAPRLG